MKVFLSWSGTKSHEVAKLLSEWLASVIQSCKPWISSRDIDRGSLWFTEINDQLQSTQIGIICLTQENKEKPWILFEAGALAKGLSSSRVCTFLIDLKTDDLKDPLAQLNHTFCKEKDSVKGLVHTLNNNLGEQKLDHTILENVFETYWSQFEQKLDAILKDYPETTNSENLKQNKGSNVPEMLAELMDLTRSNASRLRRLEQEFDNYPSEKRSINRNEIELEIRRMLRAGMSNDMIVRRYKGVVPLSMLETLIEKNKEDEIPF